MNKKLLVKAGSFIISILVILIAAYVMQQSVNYVNNNANSTDNAVTEIILSVQSDGVYISKDENNWQRIDNQSKIEAGIYVKTDETGFATVVFPDNSIMRINSSSVVQIAEFKRDDNTVNTDLKLITGEIWNKVTKFVTEDSSYTVTTDSAVASVRGTEFDVKYDGNIFEHYVVEGVTSVTAGEQEKTVEAGNMLTYNKEVRVLPIPDYITGSEWYQQNTEMDQKTEEKQDKGQGGVKGDQVYCIKDDGTMKAPSVKEFSFDEKGLVIKAEADTVCDVYYYNVINVDDCSIASDWIKESVPRIEIHLRGIESGKYAFVFKCERGGNMSKIFSKVFEVK